MIWIMGLAFLVLCLVGMPIALSLGISSAITLIGNGNINLMIMPQRILAGVDSFPMLALPFFLLAAAFMSGGGIVQRIINMFNATFGHIRGSLAYTNVAASLFFAGMSGSGIADTSSIGAVLIPAMIDEGYDADFTVAVTAASSVLGPIVPPSIPLIIYGVTTGVSVIRLFLASIIPGFLLAITQFGLCHYYSHKRNYPVHGKVDVKDTLRILKDGLWAIIMPLILVLGILFGVFTVTELACVSVVYALIVGLFVYKSLKWDDIPRILKEVAVDTAVVMFIIGCTTLFSWVLTMYRVPQTVSAAITTFAPNKYIFLALSNVLFVIAGMFLDSTPATLMLVPILLPAIKSLGIDVVHFGVVMVFNLMLGLLTPPVGICLMLGAQMGKISLNRAFKAAMPFLLAGFAVLILITYLPGIVMLIPNLIMGH